jgi:hypothetical protein
VVPAKCSVEASKLIQAGNGVRSERSAIYDNELLLAMKVSDGNEMLKGFEGPMLTVRGPESWPACESTSVMFTCALVPVSFATSSLDTMFATAPAEPAAAIVMKISPASFACGVPESVRLLLSSDSHEGPATREYCSLSESLWKVVGANWKENRSSTRATGGICALRG